MSKPITALCNHCGTITDVKYQHKNHPNGIEETFFKCEHCFYHYTCFVTDPRVRKMQRKRASMTGPHNAMKRLNLFDEIGERMAKLKNNLIKYGRADL